MKNIRHLFFSLALTGVFFGCSYTPPEPAEDPTNPRTPPVAGSADFGKYVAVGNSLTAGFMDNALYEEGQNNSFAVILAERMKLVNGGAAFNVPTFDSPTGAGFGGFAPGANNPPVPMGRYRFVLPSCPANPAATATLGLSPAPTVPGDNLTPFGGNRAALNNFGVPGAKIYHSVVQGYGANLLVGNPFFWRFASGQTASLIGDAVAAQGTFFTYWLGNNDVLSYALSGGSGNPNPGLDPSKYGSNDMTEPAVFSNVLTNTITALLSTSPTTKGVIATIPDVVRIPYFQVINATLTAGANPAVPFNLTQAQADQLNAGYRQLGPAAAQVNFRPGKVNYPVILTATGIRHMNPARDFLVMTIPQDNLLLGPISACNPNPRAGWGISEPIPNNFVLDEAEVLAVNDRVTAYNTLIQAEAASRGDRIAVVDMYTVLRNLTPERNNLAPGGYFSLDGVHPNPRGHALIANEFIRAINAKWGSTLPPVNIMDYRQNILPTAQ